MDNYLKLDQSKAAKWLSREDSKNAIGNLKLECHLISELIHKCSSYEESMWALYKESRIICLSTITSLLQDISILEPQLSWSCLLKQRKYAREYNDRHHRSKYILATQ